MTTGKDEIPAGGQLRDEAANWFSIMRGPEADERRAEFEAWLALGALHRTAYNRIAETFSLGKGLKPPSGDQDGEQETDAVPPPKGSRGRRLAAGGLAVALIAGAAALGGHFLRVDPSEQRTAAVEARASPSSGQLATSIGEIRSFPLADGSTVTLDSDSLVVVSISGTRRDLHLVRGRARFMVAHDARPFVVAVAGGTVTARGTVFDVSVDQRDRVTVRLLRGSVDVAVRKKSENAVSPDEIRRMTVGEVVTFGAALPIKQEKPPVESLNWPEGVSDLDRVRLADLVAEANRYATKSLVLESTELGELRLSGTFRLRDTRKLAENIGDLLGLAVIDRGDAFVLAKTCPTTKQENCRPPS